MTPTIQITPNEDGTCDVQITLKGVRPVSRGDHWSLGVVDQKMPLAVAVSPRATGPVHLQLKVTVHPPPLETKLDRAFRAQIRPTIFPCQATSESSKRKVTTQRS